MSTTPVLQLHSMLFASDVLQHVSKNLERGVTVTPIRLTDAQDQPLLDLEIRVTRIGAAKVARTTTPARKT